MLAASMCAMAAKDSGVAIRSGRRAGQSAFANASRALAASSSYGCTPAGNPLHHGGVMAGMTEA